MGRDERPADGVGEERGEAVLELFDPAGEQVAGLRPGVLADGQQPQAEAVL